MLSAAHFKAVTNSVALDQIFPAELMSRGQKLSAKVERVVVA
jgi:hypothetical protein